MRFKVNKLNFTLHLKNINKFFFLQSQSSDSEDGKGGIASFLPKDQVWKWADKGQKRSKGRVYHKVIERKDERLGIGDSAVFLSTNCPDQPYIGRLESMWETASGTKNVGVRWYYHLAEIECSDAEDKQNIKKIKHPKVSCYFTNILFTRLEDQYHITVFENQPKASFYNFLTGLFTYLTMRIAR